MDRRELLDKLNCERQSLLDELEGIGETNANISEVVGTWSTRDLVSHFVAWEEEAIQRLELMAQGREDMIRYIDEAEIDDLNKRAVYSRQGMSWVQLLDELVEVRGRLLSAIDTCSDDHFRVGMIPVLKWLPVFTYLHEAEHAEQLRAWRAERRP